MSLTVKHISRIVSNPSRLLRNVVQAPAKRGALVQCHANPVQGYTTSTRAGKFLQRSHLSGGFRSVHCICSDKTGTLCGHIAVICLSEIPATTLDYFLQCIQEELDEEVEIHGNEDITVTDEVVFITSKDVKTITSGATRPAKTFTSPFIGESIKQLYEWFIANLRSLEAFTSSSFMVLDSRTVKDNTCLVVCTLDDELRTIRCDFKAGRHEIYAFEYGCDRFSEGHENLFAQTGEVLTDEKYRLALEDRLYVEDGKVKIKAE